MILSCSKTFVEKRIAENRMQDMWNSCLDFISKEMWRLNSPELNHLGHYVCENIRGQSQVSSKTEDIAEFEEMLQMAEIRGTIDRAVNEFLKRLNACVVAKGGHFYHSH